MRLLVMCLCCLLLVGTGSAQEPVTVARQERSELRFLEGMSDHHQMALDMANHGLEKAVTPAVRELMQAIIDAQTPEIEQMRAWLLAWYGVDYAVMPMAPMTQPAADPHAGHGGHGGHGGSATPATDPAMMMGMFAGFNRLDGVAYDIAWLESMIDHHDDALHMSQRLLDRGVVHAELAALAQAIIDAQTAEIEMMERLLSELAVS